MRQTHFSWLSFLNWTPVTFNNALVNFWGPRHWNFGKNYFKMNFVTLLIFSAVLHWAVRRLFILSIGIFRLNGCKPQNNKTFTLPTPYQQHLWAIEIHFEFPIKAFASLSFRSKFIYWLLWSTTSSLIYVKQFWKLQKLDFAKPALEHVNKLIHALFLNRTPASRFKRLEGNPFQYIESQSEGERRCGLDPFLNTISTFIFSLQLVHPRPHNMYIYREWGTWREDFLFFVGYSSCAAAHWWLFNGNMKMLSTTWNFNTPRDYNTSLIADMKWEFFHTNCDFHTMSNFLLIPITFN